MILILIAREPDGNLLLSSYVMEVGRQVRHLRETRITAHAVAGLVLIEKLAWNFIQSRQTNELSEQLVLVVQTRQLRLLSCELQTH